MKATALHFIVHGPPVPKQRPRLGAGGHTYTPERTRSYEARVCTQSTLAVIGQRGAWQPSREDRYALTVHVWFAANRGDLDNVVKAIADGITKSRSVWPDDKAVVELHAFRHVDKDHPRVEVVVGLVP